MECPTNVILNLGEEIIITWRKYLRRSVKENLNKNSALHTYFLKDVCTYFLYFEDKYDAPNEIYFK